MSLPARGVWIEIVRAADSLRHGASLPARGVWIEMSGANKFETKNVSLPARGVWIEMGYPRQSTRETPVTPREGSVD